MEYVNKINPNISGYRCDQCYNSHVKCDKLENRCSRCIKRQIECTFNRKIIYNKTDKSKYEYKKQRSNENNSDNFSFIYIKEAKFKSKKAQFKETSYSLIKLPKDYNFSYNILGIFNRFQRKILLENLLSFIQSPSPFFPSKGLDLFIKLTDKLGLLTSKPRKLRFIPEVPKGTKFDIGPILKQALISYFKFINTTFPLFDITRFKFFSCSFELKSAILIGGLLYMEQTEVVKNLINYFEGKLYSFIYKVPRIQPCLQNIQLILILIVGIPYFSWIASLKEFLLFHCYRMSFTIGIYQPSKKLSKEVNAERVYTYCLLSSYYNGASLMVGSYIAEPMFPLELKRLDKCLANKSNGYCFDFDKDDKGIQQYIFLKLQEFYYIISTIFFDLKLVKEMAIKERKSLLKVDDLLIKLAFKAVAVNERYTKVMDNILIKIKNQDLKVTIEGCQNSITYFFHHINFYICSIRFSASKEKKAYEYNEHINDKYIDIDMLKYAEAVFKECYLVIDSSIASHHKYTLAFDYVLVSICLVFMLRYGRNEDKNIIYIQKGKEFLESFLMNPSAMILCRINLKLIEIITGSFKSTSKMIRNG
ncbi:hypothetical protein K502DRAFT_345474 [Neoconidiobolus thromboides FSU 785]|nr:hypothetical protein K502DRAFT_345474 [Neoconidiobolus thromboides FSU 785]